MHLSLERVFSKVEEGFFCVPLSVFFGVAANNLDDMVFHACHTYAVKRAVDTRRGGEIVLNASYVSNLVCNAHQTAALASIQVDS